MKLTSLLIKRTIYLSLFLCGLSMVLKAQTKVKAPTKNIKNDVFWNTSDGGPIYSQGGGVFSFPDPVTGLKKFYWYGANYLEAESYRQMPAVTQKTATFKSVTCYTSTDLVNWEQQADVLTKTEVNQSGKDTWVGRLGVAYVAELKKYALIVQHGSRVLITVSDSPAGPFTWHQEINMEPMIGTTNTGDQTVFTDEDNGKSYLIYSYGRGRNKIYVSEIGVKDGKVNLLDCTKVFQGESREGNCMFKYKGKYYLCASNIYGWDASYAYFLVADHIRGPYTPVNDMKIMKGSEDDYAHVTQTGFFITLKNNQKELVIHCGDRWANFAGNGLGYNQWCPLSFDGETPYFNSLSSWNLEISNGTWTVANDNNFAKNGSFEADRNRIPSPVKPVQTRLLGWETIITEGNQIELNKDDSPVLNYFNTEIDRRTVIGEKSLHISDKIHFKRKVKQAITSTPFVKLPDGLYTMTAKMKNSGGFEKLEMYAESKGKISTCQIQAENTVWQTLKINNIPVKGGRVEIGFVAEGSAHAFCDIDDISLVKTP